MNENLTEKLKKIKYFLLDMDGTVYLGDKLIGKMNETLDLIRKSGKKIIYLTNNSSKNVDEYVEKLTRLDLFRDGDEVYTSGMAAIEFLLRERKGKTVNLLGVQTLKDDLTDSGITLTDTAPDVCLLAYDSELTYDKLRIFTDGLFAGAEYVATHPDAVCPADPFPVPDAGAFISMIKTATGRLPEIIIGKPEKGMGEELKSRFKAKSDEFLMVGDRLYTDIAFGLNCGFYTLLVLSGETTVSDLAATDKKPDFVLDSLNSVKEYL